MNAYGRPPHYLTDTEFDRLRLSDEQWEKMELQLLKRSFDARKGKREREEKEQQNERVIRPVAAAVVGIFLAALAYSLIEEFTDTEMWDLMENPLSFLAWTAVSAWMMRKA